jgi:hypothetical protein
MNCKAALVKTGPVPCELLIIVVIIPRDLPDEGAINNLSMRHMKKIIAACLAKFTFISVVFGQSATIKGRITDTLEHKQIHNAVIALLRTSDSLLISHTRSDSNGIFSLPVLSEGKYVLLISHPRYTDYIDTLPAQNSSVLNLGNIAITPRSQLLQEVIVRQKVPLVRIKGDTTEYLADSFKLQPNANVEDLLRILPGIQVNKKGEIVAQGKRVEKVLVDGEEFFSEDPTVATQNLRADMVDKVQVFDKKSKQAEFTGIDDGIKTKTINLKIKEDRKKGYFGYVKAASNLKKYYDYSAILSSFKGNRQLVAGVMGNNRTMGSAGTTLISSNTGGNSAGIMESRSIGGHYSNRWMDGAHHFSSNYKYDYNRVKPEGSTITQNILPENNYVNYQQYTGDFTQKQFNLTPVYDLRLDSLSTLQFSLNSTVGSYVSSNNFESGTTINEQLVNSSTRSSSEEGNKRQVEGNVLLQKRLNRPGRTISAKATYINNYISADGFLYAVNNFYGSMPGADTIDQRKEIVNNSTTIRSGFNYTELIAKKILMDVHYTFSVTDQNARHQTYGRGAEKYDNYLDSLSNQYNLRINTHTAGVNWQLSRKKMQYTLGTDASWSHFRQHDLAIDYGYSRNFLNLLPRVSVQHRINNYKKLTLTYTGNPKQPDLQQMQPLQNNTDPLNIYLGNPDLRPSFTHDVTVRFEGFKSLTQQFLNAGLSYRTTANDFSTQNLVDTLGRRVTQTVNVNGNWQAESFIYYSWQPKELSFSFSGNAMVGEQVNYVNYEQNHTLTTVYSLKGGLRWHKPNQVYLSGQSGIVFNYARSSINTALATRYYTHEHNIDFRYYLPWKMIFDTDCTFSFRQRTSVFDKNNNVVLWNAALEKNLFNNVFSLRMSVHDILDQNKGFSRMVSGNLIIENNQSILRQYWLLSLTWNLGKKPGGGIENYRIK